MHAGTLVTIEGVDGAGKSTLASSLADALRAAGQPVELLREPGGVVVSERIRAIVQDPALHVAPRTEALLYAAARAQLVDELLLPLLEAGAFVLLDRFLDSSLAYQGAARGLGVDAVRAINQFGTASLEPDRTLLLSISADTARARTRAREPDRLEAEDASFFAAVERGYLELAQDEPNRIVTIDASMPPDQVHAAAMAALSDLL
jgi:dTMP kinase